MKLRPVRGYKKAKYPTLKRHLLKKALGTKAFWMVLATSLATLATMLGGCGTIEP